MAEQMEGTAAAAAAPGKDNRTTSLASIINSKLMIRSQEMRATSGKIRDDRAREGVEQYRACLLPVANR